MAKQLDGEEMRMMGRLISATIPGLGFALITFEFGDDKKSPTNYISNGQREDMINALQEVLDRWKDGTDYMTPNNN